MVGWNLSAIHSTSAHMVHCELASSVFGFPLENCSVDGTEN